MLALFLQLSKRCRTKTYPRSLSRKLFIMSSNRNRVNRQAAGLDEHSNFAQFSKTDHLVVMLLFFAVRTGDPEIDDSATKGGRRAGFGRIAIS